jgi:hypothetical protein
MRPPGFDKTRRSVSIEIFAALSAVPGGVSSNGLAENRKCGENIPANILKHG